MEQQSLNNAIVKKKASDQGHILQNIVQSMLQLYSNNITPTLD